MCLDTSFLSIYDLFLLIVITHTHIFCLEHFSGHLFLVKHLHALHFNAILACFPSAWCVCVCVFTWSKTLSMKSFFFTLHYTNAFISVVFISFVLVVCVCVCSAALAKMFGTCISFSLTHFLRIKEVNWVRLCCALGISSSYRPFVIWHLIKILISLCVIIFHTHTHTLSKNLCLRAEITYFMTKKKSSHTLHIVDNLWARFCVLIRSVNLSRLKFVSRSLIYDFSLVFVWKQVFKQLRSQFIDFV